MDNQSPSRNQAIQLSIAGYRVHSMRTGIFGLDGGAMFGTVPKTLWEKTNPADDHNRIELEARALLLISPTKKILVDVGLGGDFEIKYGPKLGPKFAEIYAVGVQNSLEHSLAHHDLELKDITDVILTHLHFDHAGGATKSSGGQLEPTFPNATYHLQRANLDTARKPNLREKASYFAPNFEPLLEKNCLRLLDGDLELLPGIRVIVSDGHTQGQQLVEVYDSERSLIYCGDIIPTSSHVRLPFVMGYDLRPLQVIEEKKAQLEKVADNKGYIFFEHDPHCDLASIAREGSDFRVKERYQLT